MTVGLHRATTHPALLHSLSIPRLSSPAFVFFLNLKYKSSPAVFSPSTPWYKQRLFTRGHFNTTLWSKTNSGLINSQASSKRTAHHSLSLSLWHGHWARPGRHTQQLIHISLAKAYKITFSSNRRCMVMITKRYLSTCCCQRLKNQNMRHTQLEGPCFLSMAVHICAC